MKNMHGIVFAYSSNLRLKELTEYRTASSIPYGSRYRVIDFMISNLINAGVTDIGVIMRENYQSLLDHLGAGRDWDLARKRGGLRLLPPFAYQGARYETTSYRGKLEALHSITNYIKYIQQEYVVIADGCWIANLPLEDIYKRHVEKGVDITCVCLGSATSLGSDSIYESDAYFRADKNGNVSEVLLSSLDSSTFPSIGTYILSRKLLGQLLADSAAHKYVGFGDFLQRMQSRLNISAYIHKGFAANPQTVLDYFKCSMELLTPKVRGDIFSRSRPVKTKVRDEASTYYSPESNVIRSLVADGCTIEGSLENCIVFRGVKVEKGAVLKNCILMQDTHIEEDVNLSYVITDKEVFISKGRNRSIKGLDSYPIAISKGTRM